MGAINTKLKEKFQFLPFIRTTVCSWRFRAASSVVDFVLQKVEDVISRAIAFVIFMLTEIRTKLSLLIFIFWRALRR